MDQQTNKLKADLLAGEILQLAHASLMLHLRFMESALCRLRFEPVPKGTIWTDGQRFSYAPRHVLGRYREEREAPAREYLHCVLHCVFRHMYLHGKVEQKWWSLACDMIVEDLIASLRVRGAASKREARQQEVLAPLREEVRPFTAEKLYRRFLDGPLPEEERTRLEELFRADDHSGWFSQDKKKESESDDSSPDLPEPNAPPTEGEQDWSDVAESIEEDLETISREAGDTAGSLRRALRALNREKRDYAAFLRKFAVRGEVLHLDMAEFDYIYYTYGLSLYGNMPLIEPLEYREDLRIRSFVIAIDTSASVSEELVQAFLQKTFNILKASESFFSRVEIRILQCDTQIQDDVRITNLQDLDSAIRGMKLRGFGGTDFRPVFRYVDELRRGGELRQLKGLLYFTDGMGTYPQQKPDYDAAFIFLENEGSQYDVPVWAMKLTLEPEEILEAV
ncbi:MAG: metallopeptidase [Oscillospiraceae bacterium]|nr:metallopeptidase [Oscillospiraceae bacterium]